MVRLYPIVIPVLLLLNIILKANGWIGEEFFYLVVLIMSVHLMIKSKYIFPSIFVVGVIFLLRIVEVISPDLTYLRDVFTAIFFIILAVVLYSTKKKLECK